MPGSTSTNGTPTETQSDPYSPESLSRLSRADIEFGLQTQLLVLDLQLAHFRQRLAKSNKLRSQMWMLRGRNTVLAGQWLALAHEALDEAEKTIRKIGRMLTFMGGQEADAWAAAWAVSERGLS